MAKLLIILIRIYQKTLSPDHGWFKFKYPYGYCRYYPSCSEYAIGVLSKYSLIKSVPLILKRVVKCNPFTSPQIDKY